MSRIPRPARSSSPSRYQAKRSRPPVSRTAPTSSPFSRRRPSASIRPAGISASAAVARSSIWKQRAYLDWKREKVVNALHAARIDVAVADIVPCAPHTRRRVTFSARRADQGAVFGFHRALSSEIVDISECPISLPEIVAAVPRLRVLAGMIGPPSQPFHMTVTATASGLDVAAQGAGQPGEGKRRLLSEFAVAQGFARLSVDGEIIIEPRKPTVAFGDAAVILPPGAFLQATAYAEQAMADLVVSHLSRAKKVADLFAGCRQLRAAARQKAEVHAVEGDAAAVAALDRALRQAPASGASRRSGATCSAGR